MGLKMIKLLTIFFSIFLLASCDKVSKDLAHAPSDQQIKRYGFDHIKLGSPADTTLKRFQNLTGITLQCEEKKKSFGEKIKRVFILKSCHLPKQHKLAKFWNETLKKFDAIFLDNRLVLLKLELQTKGDYEKLYDKHGKHILSLLGKPRIIDLAYVKWKKHHDEAIIEDKGHGLVSVLIQNKKVMEHLK